MKKFVVIFTNLILILVLVACGGESAGAEKTNTSSLNTNYSNAISAPAQLALGSIKLEETDLAIDEEQASQLLPLWQGYVSLYNSNTAADAEISALFQQIQNAMTDDQITAIGDMELTEDDSTAYVEEMGTQLSGGFVVRSESEAPDIGGMGRPGGGGGMPGGGGGMPAGGGGMPAGGGMMGGMMGGGMMNGPMGWEEMSEEELAAAIKAGGMMTASSDQTLINALIMTLRTKTGEMATEGMPGGMAGGSGMFMDTISEITGIPAETLQEEMANGSTLADVITANGGDLDAVRAGIEESMANSVFPMDDVDQFIDNLLNGTFQQMDPGQAPGDMSGEAPGEMPGEAPGEAPGQAPAELPTEEP